MNPPASSGRHVGVVSEDPILRDQAGRKLAELGYRVATGACARDVVDGSRTVPAAILYRAESEPELSVAQLEAVLREAGRIPVILFSDFLDSNTAMKAVRLGAVDCLSGSEGEMRLSASIEAASSRPSVSRPEVSTSGISASLDDFLAVSPSMLALKKTAQRIAQSDVTVLIQGESGVGKEVVARYIHQHSAAANEPFVKVNCAAIPDELLESELFGHEKGAFTGAMTTKQGKFELAEGGTMLLDEISEMRVSLQAKLLGVLQDGGFMRLGGTRTIRCRSRICSTTNVSLEEAIEAGLFREDLYFRLKVIDLHIPPLRDRREDILFLAKHLLEGFARDYKRPALELTAALEARLLAHPWPGNVRELENLLKAAAVMGDVDWAMQQLEPGAKQRGSTAAAREPRREPDAPLAQIRRRAVAEAERPAIVAALEREHWNRRKAARRLAVSYKTLLKKMREYGIEPPEDSAT